MRQAVKHDRIELGLRVNRGAKRRGILRRSIPLIPLPCDCHAQIKIEGGASERAAAAKKKAAD
jgi:hypothetical protein